MIPTWILALFLVFALEQPNEPRIVHVHVALCDNASQGIVPVPEHLGDGDSPQNNLYWGALYGVKSYFASSKTWKRESGSKKPSDPRILERVVFKHVSKEVYIVADAHQGKEIKGCIESFLAHCDGQDPEYLSVNGKKLKAGGFADLQVYVGHNGLMEFSVEESVSGKNRTDAMIFACASKAYFEKLLRKSNTRALIHTTGLMAPEAYTLHAALEGWVMQESGPRIRDRAAKAYNKYQKCGENAAKRLFTGDP